MDKYTKVLTSSKHRGKNWFGTLKFFYFRPFTHGQIFKSPNNQKKNISYR